MLQNSPKTYQLLQAIFLLWIIGVTVPILFHIGEAELVIPRQQCEFFCHQKLNRFIEINSFLPFVCGRCLGIYSALFVFSFIDLSFFRKATYYFFIPSILDKILEHFTAISITNEIRFLSGVFIAIGLLVLMQLRILKSRNESKFV